MSSVLHALTWSWAKHMLAGGSGGKQVVASCERGQQTRYAREKRQGMYVETQHSI